MLRDVRENSLEHVCEAVHHRKVALDKSHLGIEADVLVSMARGRVGLGSKDGTDFIDLFKDADHDLLVELWALGQVGGLVKVIDLEHVRPAFCGAGDDFGNHVWRLGQATT